MIQPTIPIVLAEIDAALANLDEATCQKFIDQLQIARRIFVTGEGRSGLIMRMLAMRLTHLGRTAFVVGDVTTPALTADDLLVVCSGSGATPIPCLRAERARQLGATVVAITGQPTARLAHAAQIALVIAQPASDNLSTATRTIQFGGSRFEQCALILCDALAFVAMQQWGIDPRAMQARHANLE